MVKVIDVLTPVVALHSFEGVVEQGDALGRVLGFPTANVPISDSSVDGVWAGKIQVSADAGERSYVAAISVGTRPTYYLRGERLLEAHILDFDGDLYGQAIKIQLHFLIRPQSKFESSRQLVDQIALDVAVVREWAAALQSVDAS